MNSFNITIKLSTLYEFLSYGNCNSLTKYTIALTSLWTVHYNDRLVKVFTFEIEIFTKNDILIYIFFRRTYSHSSKGSYAFMLYALRSYALYALTLSATSVSGLLTLR